MTDDPTDDEGDGSQSTRAMELSYDIDDDESPSEAVVRAAAAVTDTPVLDLEPLYDAIDPEHLDGLFENRATRGGSITFECCNCIVTVSAGSVRVRETEEDTDC